jgi:hypothetical protein
VAALAGLVLLLLVPATAAFAQTTGTAPYPNPSTPSTTDPCLGRGPAVSHANGVTICTVSATQTTSTSSGALAFTGGNIALLVLIGAAILGGGFVLVRLSRRPANNL